MSWRDTPVAELALVVLVLAVIGGRAWAAGPVVGPIMISDPFATPQQKGAATVLSMTVTNNGDVSDHLIRAACPDAGSVTFEAPAQDGSAGLHPVEGFEVPARKAIVLKSDGWQIVLHDLGRGLAVGDVVPCTVTFALSGEQIVQAGVQEGAP